ncbi:MAG: hypothetical protein Tsb002_16890 [Wenzhouxiangellaceae bacterium]
MSVDLLKRYYAAWGTGDADAVCGFFTADCVFEDLAFEARFQGRDGVREFARITYAGVPDFQVDPVSIIVEGEQAAAMWVMSGTHAGDLPNLPASGQRFSVRASSIIRLRSGQIESMIDFWNPVQFQKAVARGD